MPTVKVGVIGCGAISGAYIKNAKTFPILDLVAFADLDSSKALKAATDNGGGAKACTVDELLADKSIDMVLNLTIPKVHAEVALRALEAGKHVYSEKPLAVTREEGKQIMNLAAKKDLRVGCAPDTFLGAGVQTCRKLLDDGAIGKVVAATAFMMCAGHESWHPSPEFYYKKGGGPMFDMGPYYLTALLHLLGPITKVAGLCATTRPQRTITSQPLAGTVIDVETPDHVAGTVQFASGAIGTVVMSFATRGNPHSPMTLLGTEGTLAVPDPNGFDGVVKLRKPGQDWEEVPHTHPKGYGRSAGLADMAHAIQTNRPHRASGEQAYAVLDIMQGFLDSSDNNTIYRVTAPYQRTAGLPADHTFGVLEK